VRRRIDGTPAYVDGLLVELQLEGTLVGDLSTEELQHIRGLAVLRAFVEAFASAVDFGSTSVRAAREAGADGVRIGSTTLDNRGFLLRREAQALSTLRELCRQRGLTHYFGLSWKRMLVELAREKPWLTRE
jgi:hypothetical protein